jgi:hypothetical protein
VNSEGSTGSSSGSRKVSLPAPACEWNWIQALSRAHETRAFLLKQGGFGSYDERNNLLEILPEGFPEKVSRWESPEGSFRVIGYAHLESPGLKLPSDYDATGVWVEADIVNGERRRSLYLPDIGEAERRVWRGGRWEPALRLVARSFTDLPKSR